MPQVASDPTFHVHNPHLPRLARPTQPSDRAPSPFESLLDEGTQAADQPAPTPADTKAASTDGSQTPAKTSDSKAPATNDSAATATAAPAKPEDGESVEKPSDGRDGKAVCGTKAAVNAQIVDGATGGDGPKPESDDKPADGQKTDTPGVPAPTAIVQTTASTDAIVVAPTPAPVAPATVVPDQNDQDGQPPQQIMQAAETGLQLKSLDSNSNIPKAAAGKLSDSGKPADGGKQIESDQSASEITDSAQTTTKATPEPHADKQQFAVNESDKDHVAQARGEPLANGHHANSDAPAPVSTDSSIAAPKIIADTGTQTTVPTTPAHAAAAAPATLVSQPGPQAAAIPLSGVAIEIAGKALAGKNRFDIRLDPPELGRIEVRLDVDRDGNVTSRLTVDRADTLDLLRRDASGLERALQDAGLKTADNSLQFSLRDQSMNQRQTGGGSDTAQIVVNDDTPPAIDAIPQNYGRLAGTGGGLDIRV